jgi:hypothetical protein
MIVARAQGAGGYGMGPCGGASWPAPQPPMSAPSLVDNGYCDNSWNSGCSGPPSSYAPYGAVSPNACVGCTPDSPPSCYACSSPIVWGVRAGALFLSRADANHEFFSYDSAVETYQLLDAREAANNFLPGVDAEIERFDLCTMRGVEGIYWGLFPSAATAYLHAT